MRILVLNFNQKHVLRGLESFLEGLEKEMQKKGVEFEILSSSESVSLVNSSKNFLAQVAHRLYFDNYSLRVLIFTLKSLPRLWRQKPDILMPTNGGWQVLIARVLKFLLKIKIVIIGEAGIGFDDAFNLKFGKPDCFVALTEEQSAWAKKIAPNIWIKKIHNGIDLEKFCPQGKKIQFNLPRPIILLVAAFDRYKRINLTINAVSKLKKGSLIILGSGLLEKKIKLLAKEQLAERHLLTKVNYQDLPKWYRSADIFTLASDKQEAFGNVYLEAMACGLPIVATDDNKRKEIIGQAGLFVDPENSAEYARILEKALAIDWGKTPLNQAKKFAWEKIGDQYYQIFEELVRSYNL